MFDSLAQTILGVTHKLTASAEADMSEKASDLATDRRTRSLIKRLPMETNSDLAVLLSQQGEADPSRRAA